MMATGTKLATPVQILWLTTDTRKQATHMASETRIYTQRGRRKNQWETAIRLVLNVYMVGTAALGTPSATSTVINLPKPPKGDSTPYSKPPTDELFWKAAFHSGTS